MVNHLLYEVRLVYQPGISIQSLPTIQSSYDMYKALQCIWADDIYYIERFYALFLNADNRVLGYMLIGMGSQTACTIEPKSIYQASILSHSAAVAIAHNHPSGNPLPSSGDKLLTLKIKEGLRIFDIKLLDHLILADHQYYSFSDRGQL